MRRKINGLDFEESVDWVEELNKPPIEWTFTSPTVNIAWRGDTYVIYDDDGPQLVLGRGQILTRED